MTGPVPQPPARVVSQEEIPMPPPGRPRRASILVRTIGDLRATEPEEGMPVRRTSIVHVIGGANGDDDVRVSAPSVIHIIGGANGDDDRAFSGPSVIPVIGGANGADGDDGADGDEITATGGIRVIGSIEDGAR